jgi:two-component system alkaline phosphatase synthesis response regulator PhoP
MFGHMTEEIWQKKKVCIIDDDPNLREIYLMKFNQEGFDVSLAINGEEGMQSIREKRPDIILLDLQMPVKNGVEVLQELEADSELSKIPVIILTNIDNEDAFREVGKFETRFYLIKSLTTPQKAVDYVREVL